LRFSFPSFERDIIIISIERGTQMGKVILYLAVSLDGYIADEKGGYDFLQNYSNMESLDFQGFMNRIGTIVMGRKSYEQARQNNQKWEYEAFQTYVYSRHPPKEEVPHPVQFTDMKPRDLCKKLKAESEKDIWLFGGSEIIDLFIQDQAVDEYWIYYVAEVLSKGIPLFKTPMLDALQVAGVRQFENVVEIRFTPKKPRD
jgi:dihydrofolate reductase